MNQTSRVIGVLRSARHSSILLDALKARSVPKIWKRDLDFQPTPRLSHVTNSLVDDQLSNRIRGFLSISILYLNFAAMDLSFCRVIYNRIFRNMTFEELLDKPEIFFFWQKWVRCSVNNEVCHVILTWVITARDMVDARYAVLHNHALIIQSLSGHVAGRYTRQYGLFWLAFCAFGVAH